MSTEETSPIEEFRTTPPPRHQTSPSQHSQPGVLNGQTGRVVHANSAEDVRKWDTLGTSGPKQAAYKPPGNQVPLNVTYPPRSPPSQIPQQNQSYNPFLFRVPSSSGIETASATPYVAQQSYNGVPVTSRSVSRTSDYTGDLMHFSVPVDQFADITYPPKQGQVNCYSLSYAMNLVNLNCTMILIRNF